jgi:hypothetical protein
MNPKSQSRVSLMSASIMQYLVTKIHGHQMLFNFVTQQRPSQHLQCVSYRTFALLIGDAADAEVLYPTELLQPVLPE